MSINNERYTPPRDRCIFFILASYIHRNCSRVTVIARGRQTRGNDIFPSGVFVAFGFRARSAVGIQKSLVDRLPRAKERLFKRTI